MSLSFTPEFKSISPNNGHLGDHITSTGGTLFTVHGSGFGAGHIDDADSQNFGLHSDALGGSFCDEVVM